MTELQSLFARTGWRKCGLSVLVGAIYMTRDRSVYPDGGTDLILVHADGKVVVVA